MIRKFVSTPTRPPSGGKTRSEGPFANRKNFPIFEDAIRTETTFDESSPDKYDNEGTDNSICSCASTNMLNLTIGARAALDEHLRHVAKFGIDDSHFLDRSGEQDRSFESHPGDPRDVLWEKLVDPNFLHNSTNNSSHILSPDMLRLFNKASVLQPADRGQDIEAGNDYSSDFFNSSRVNFLKTPERYRSLQMNAVTNRNDVDESFVGSESQLELLRSVANYHPFHEPETTKDEVSPCPVTPGDDRSFLFSAVDLSRISANGSEDGALKQSPDSAFALRDRRTKIGVIRNYPAIKENILPMESGHNSPLLRSLQQISETSPQKALPPLDPNNFSFGFCQKRSPPITPQSKVGRENAPDFAENLTLSPIGLQSTYSHRKATPPSKLLRAVADHQENPPLSPPALQPRDGHTKSQSNSGRDNAPDFAENLTLSPISSRNSSPRRQIVPSPKLLHSAAHHKQNRPLPPPPLSPRDDNISSMIVEYCATPRGAPDSDVSALQNSSSENPNMSKDTLSRSLFRDESPTSASSALLLLDRRRFRTVVPTRVFLNNSDDFPEEYDSISALPLSSHAEQSDSRTTQTMNW